MFAQLLNCVREEKHTLDDIVQIQSLANKDTTDLLKDCLKLHLKNYVNDQENKHCIIHIDSIDISVVDSQKD